MRARFVILLLTILLAHLSSSASAQDADTVDKPKGGPAEFKHLKFRLVGPDVGGRVSRSTGVPGDALTFYAAAASGGVWKSSDGGMNWKPIFDDQPVSSIGSIAAAPSDPNTLYVGTGEANIRGNVAAGNGIYKSLDAGKTWKQVWKQEGQIGTLIVHPSNPEIAFAAVLGHAFGPNPERGVYRTTDGGKNWQKVLGKDENTGASDVCFDPSNPKILFAGLWQARRFPWDLVSGGPGSGLYMSHDGGDTWKQLGPRADPEAEGPGKGLPTGIWGKIGVGVAASDGRRVYALIEAEKGGLYRSDDGGETWKLASAARYLRQRSWYFSTLTIDPRNPDVIWCPTVPMLRSIDGGKSFQRMKGFHHGDHHDLWIDPKNPRRMIASNDGGVDVTHDGGQSWFAPALPLAQFYHVAADERAPFPYHVSGCMQDFGTAAGPSDNLSVGGISRSDWHDIGGGEAGFTAPDPKDPNIVYAGEYGGYLSRYDARTRQSQNVSVYPTNPSGHGGEDLRYRFQWTAPILVSRHNHQVIYHGANVLFKSTDEGRHWSAISPDLTSNDKTKQKWAGGPITGDNTGVEIYCTIFALAESPVQEGLLWVGSDDGRVHVSKDGGGHWEDVTKNIPGLPQWATVRCIEPSAADVGAAYLVGENHRLDDMRPYLWKTTDFGKTWNSLTAGLPPDAYLHAVREDPKKKGLLYVGTERGVSFSTDDGKTWRELKLNLPTVAVHDLIVKNDDLVLATHGRSIWIFDHLTAIREMTPAIGGAEVHLFPVGDATRWRYHATFFPRGHGQNPLRGAVVDYFLKKKPQGEITLEVLDADGKLVVKLTSKKEPGQEGSATAKPTATKPEGEKADLRGKAEPAPNQPPLRSNIGPVPGGEDDPDAPEERPHKTVLTTELGVNRISWDLRYQGAEKIKSAKIDAGEPEVGPLVAPGAYTLRLTVEGKSVTRPVVVYPDPRVHLSPADVKEQLKFALAIRDDISRLAGLVQRIRTIQNQIALRNELLKDHTNAGSLIETGRVLSSRLDQIEAKLHNPRAEVTYDILAQKGGAQLYSKYGPLYSWVVDADGLPTQGMRNIYAENSRELQQLEKELDTLLATDLARLNDLARKLDIPNVIVPAKPEIPKGK